MPDSPAFNDHDEVPLPSEGEDVCDRCHEEYTLRPGSTPTGYCDPCAQQALAEMNEALRALAKKWQKKHPTCAAELLKRLL